MSYAMVCPSSHQSITVHTQTDTHTYTKLHFSGQTSERMVEYFQRQSQLRIRNPLLKSSALTFIQTGADTSYEQIP